MVQICRVADIDSVITDKTQSCQLRAYEQRPRGGFAFSFSFFLFYLASYHCLSLNVVQDKATYKLMCHF